MKKHLLLLTLVVMAFSSCKNENQVTPLENIMTRTSIRAYTDEPVSEQDIETMLRAAMAAPSAKNKQPWEFVVVTDRAVLDTLAGKLKYAKMLVQAPLAIVICANTIWNPEKPEEGLNAHWDHDASAACENLLLAAHYLGLGAVWTAASDEERSAIVKEALGIPEEYMPLAVVPIGHPAENPEPKDKWKPEKIHREKW